MSPDSDAASRPGYAEFTCRLMLRQCALTSGLEQLPQIHSLCSRGEG